jgi:hypothetical protein
VPEPTISQCPVVAYYIDHFRPPTWIFFLGSGNTFMPAEVSNQYYCHIPSKLVNQFLDHAELVGMGMFQGTLPGAAHE